MDGMGGGEIREGRSERPEAEPRESEVGSRESKEGCLEEE